MGQGILEKAFLHFTVFYFLFHLSKVGEQLKPGKTKYPSANEGLSYMIHEKAHIFLKKSSHTFTKLVPYFCYTGMFDQNGQCTCQNETNFSFNSYQQLSYCSNQIDDSGASEKENSASGSSFLTRINLSGGSLIK